jgi:hypothetical protein
LLPLFASLRDRPAPVRHAIPLQAYTITIRDVLHRSCTWIGGAAATPARQHAMRPTGRWPLLGAISAFARTASLPAPQMLQICAQIHKSAPKTISHAPVL